MDGDGWVGLIFALIAIVVAIYLLVIASFIAMAAIGVIALFAAKTGKALVKERNRGKAILIAIGWAGVLAMGCIIGSVGLAVIFDALKLFDRSAFYWGENPNFTYQIETFWGIWKAVDEWLLRDSYLFFIKLIPVLYFANRVYVARSVGGTAWLGVIPPVIAMLIFFIFDHYTIIYNFLVDPTALNFDVVLMKMIEIISLPLKLATMAFDNPQSVLAWADSEIVQSKISLFRLSHLLPTAFWIVALAAAIKAFTGFVTS